MYISVVIWPTPQSPCYVPNRIRFSCIIVIIPCTSCISKIRYSRFKIICHITFLLFSITIYWVTIIIIMIVVHIYSVLIFNNWNFCRLVLLHVTKISTKCKLTLQVSSGLRTNTQPVISWTTDKWKMPAVLRLLHYSLCPGRVLYSQCMHVIHYSQDHQLRTVMPESRKSSQSVSFQ